MTFYSIVFPSRAADTRSALPTEPSCLADLNLNQLVKALMARKRQYNLGPLLYTPLRDIATVQYRQAVSQDLETGPLLSVIKTFAEQMQSVRRHLGLVEKLEYPYHKAGWFLAAVAGYCDAVAALAQELSQAELHSQGLLDFRAYLVAYVASEPFTTLQAETRQLQAALATVTYCVTIKDSRVRVRKYEGETDYSVEVAATFERFRQGAVKDYRARLAVGTGMNHVEAAILNFVAQLYPEVFARLSAYYSQHTNFLDETLSRFDQEIQFYVAYLDYIAKIKAAGLPFCYPEVVTDSKTIAVEAGFDLVLAEKCAAEGLPVVGNDFYLQGAERLLVVSGPNQGGKTTFARMFGQLHYLASLGYPVPGRTARLFLCDQIFTHFEREEDIRNLRGKLQDDLLRIRTILDHATSQSIIIMNEIFNSTTLQDAIFLGRAVVEQILRLDALGVCVTFIDELATLNQQTVSMVSTVPPDNPAARTYHIVRQPADGLAYALTLAERHGLTYAQLQKRIRA